MIFQLLAEEVLAHQPPGLHDFLLETSILTELTPALCTAVTQNPQAPHLLGMAYRRNLFLTAVDDQMSVDTSYRYHDLFAAFLQRRLAEQHPQRLPELHRRAALAESAPREQVRHFLAAGALDEAAAVLEAIGRSELRRRLVGRRTLELILSLPDPVRARRPWLFLTLGAYHAQRGEYTAAAPYLEQAGALLQASPDEEAEIELLADQAWSEGAASAELMVAINAKLASVPQLINPAQRATFHAAAEWHYYMRFDWPDLTRHVQAGIDLALRSGDYGATAIVSQAFGPELLFNDEGMASTEQLIRHLSTLIEPEDRPLQLGLHLMPRLGEFFQSASGRI